MEKIWWENDKERQAPWQSQYNEIRLAYENKLLSLDHRTDFSEGNIGWKKFLHWNKNLAGNTPERYNKLYPLCANELNKNDEPINSRVIYEKIKNAQTCLKTGKWLLRDDFLRLAFLDYLVTEPPEKFDKKEPMGIIRDFANREGPILERCRLKPYAPDKDALTQDFVRALKKREENQ